MAATKMPRDFTHTLTQKAIVDRATEEELHARYDHRRRVRRTEDLLGQLEDLNEGGRSQVPDRLRKEIEGLLAELPVPAPKLALENVQRAVDGMFAVQERLLAQQRPEFSHDDFSEEEGEAPVGVVRRGVKLRRLPS